MSRRSDPRRGVGAGQAGARPRRVSRDDSRSSAEAPPGASSRGYGACVSRSRHRFAGERLASSTAGPPASPIPAEAPGRAGRSPAPARVQGRFAIQRRSTGERTLERPWGHRAMGPCGCRSRHRFAGERVASNTAGPPGGPTRTREAAHTTWTSRSHGPDASPGSRPKAWTHPAASRSVSPRGRDTAWPVAKFPLPQSAPVPPGRRRPFGCRPAWRSPVLTLPADRPDLQGVPGTNLLRARPRD